MRYYRRLYWGEDLKKKKEKIIRRLNTGKLQRDIYVLVLPEHGSNQLEIYNAALFLQPDFPNDDFFVVGIVRGYEAALELVEEIAGKVYEQTGAADIRTISVRKRTGRLRCDATYFDFDIKNNRHNNRCNTGNPIAIDCYFSFCAGSLRGTGKV